MSGLYNLSEGERMKNKFIRSSTLQNAVYEELFEEIVSGKLPPGTRITIDSIAKRFNVSTQPVREAIQRLSAERMVSSHNRRITVEALSRQNLKDIFSVYRIVAVYAATEGVKRVNDEVLEKLGGLIHEIELSTEDEYFTRSGRKYILSIFEEAQNPILVEILNLLLGRMGAYFRLALGTYHKKYRNDQINSFKGYLEAMAKRDVDEMARLVNESLNRLENQLEIAFDHYRHKE
jgi:DNA-binding GntR family transcriptional regulator